MSQFFTSGGQSIGTSASASVLPMNIEDWFPLRLTDLMFLQFKGLSRAFNMTVQRHKFFGTQLSLWSNSHIHMTTGKTMALTRWTFAGKVMSLLFNMLPRLVIAFLPRTKHLLISWLQSPSAVILEHKKIKPVTVSIVSPSKIPWRGKWQPTPLLLPRKSHGLRSLVQATAHGVAKSRTWLSDFILMGLDAMN